MRENVQQQKDHVHFLSVSNLNSNAFWDTFHAFIWLRRNHTNFASSFELCEMNLVDMNDIFNRFFFNELHTKLPYSSNRKTEESKTIQKL